MDLIVDHQKAYVRTHPVVFWLCVGLVIVGIIGLIAPQFVSQSAASQALPAWLRSGFYASYAIGAAMSLFGISRGKAPFEAAGMALLSSAFLAQFLILLYLLPSSIASGLFLLTLAVGCWKRSRFLARNAYPPRIFK